MDAYYGNNPSSPHPESEHRNSSGVAELWPSSNNMFAADGSGPSSGGPSDKPLLEDDRKLFDNLDHFLQGEMTQEQFQADYCKRLLFTWEWVLHLCFRRYDQALETWYELLREVGDEDVWLWTDGDEQRGHEAPLMQDSKHRRDGRWKSSGPTDLLPGCGLSGTDLRKAVTILRNRPQNRQGTSLWRQRLDTCMKPPVRFATIAFLIATSKPVRTLDSSRGIMDRTVYSLLENLNRQLPEQKVPPISQVPRWEDYARQLRNSGHTTRCIQDHSTSQIYLLFELLEIISPNDPVDLPVYWPHFYNYDDLQDKVTCVECSRAPKPLDLTDIFWRIRGTEVPTIENLSRYLSPAPRKSFLHLLWWIWYMRHICSPSLQSGSRVVDVPGWLRWLSMLAQQADTYLQKSGGGLNSILGPTKVIHGLLSREMDRFLHEGSWKYWLSLSSMFHGTCGIFDTHHRGPDDGMFLLSSEEWKLAEDLFQVPISAWYDNAEPIDPHAVCGVLFSWVSVKGVSNELSGFHSFADITHESGYKRLVNLPAQFNLNERLKSRFRDQRPSCCSQFEDGYLDWYLASLSLLLPESAISEELVWSCKCGTIDGEEVHRVLNAYLSDLPGREVEPALWGILAFCLRKADFTLHIPERFVSLKKAGFFTLRIPASFANGSGDDLSDEDVGPSQLPEDSTTRRSETLWPTPSQSSVQAITNEPSRRSAVVPRPVLSNKSLQIERIKSYLIELLRDLESSTHQVLELLPRGKQKESTLPWKGLLQILSDRGYELANWPHEVPLPGSGLCDDNKGIHGLNARHLRLLYNATQDKENPLRFRKVNGGASAHVQSEDTGRRGVTRRRDEEDVEDDGGVELAGPSKRSRVDPPRAGPSRSA